MESPVQIMLWDGMAQAVVLKFIDHATRKIETGRKIIIRSITVEYMLMMRITTRTFFISNKGFRIYGRHVQREIFIFWSHDIFPSYRNLWQVPILWTNSVSTVWYPREDLCRRT